MVDGIKVFAWPRDQQPFCNSTLFKYEEPLHLVVTNVATFAYANHSKNTELLHVLAPRARARLGLGIM